MIGVEDRDDVGVDDPECMIEVAGLGMLVRGAREITGAECLGQVADLRPISVVEQPRLVDRLEGEGRRDRRNQDLGPLVIGWDEDGDSRQPIERQAPWPSIDVPEAEGEEAEAQPGVHLEHQHRERQVPGVEVDGEERAPAEVRGGNEQRRHRDGADQGRAGGRLRRRELIGALGIEGHRAE
jgi:hypothetical protein